MKRLMVLGVIIAAGVLAVACPRANGYRGAAMFPNARFSQMLDMRMVPGAGNTAVVVSKDGLVRRFDFAGGPAVTFLDIRDRIIPNPGEEEGLLGLAFSPDYAVSGKFYVYYSAGSPRRAVISRFIARGNVGDPASERVLLEIGEPFANHNGGAMAFGPDGMLYLGVGDGGSGGDPMGNGQRLDTLLGKVLRINVAGDGGYTIPADNPFVGGGGRPEIWAYGLRNPWRISFDNVTGQLWAGDVGQNQWEEVDRIVPGGNYGWNVMEGAHCYPGGAGCAVTGFLPRAEYSHNDGCSVSGGYVYRGRAMPELQGWYVYGDFCSGRVWAVDAATNSGAAIPLANTGAAITSFGQDNDGELYMVTFDQGILKLVPK